MEMKTNHQHLKFRYLVNSYGRDPFYVKRCLKSILNQKYVDEIIIIDQNEIPIDLKEIQSQSSKIKKINFHNKSVSSARNKIPLSGDFKNSWIIFCDDDGHLDKHYSKNLLGAIILHSNVKIIAGSIIREDNLEFYSPRHDYGGNLNKFRNSKLLMGSNFCINEETFIKLGKFSENFGIGAFWGSGEETDLTWKAYFNKIPMAYDKTLKVYHVRPNFGPVKQNVKKSFRYGVGKGALVVKWIIMERKAKVLFELIEMLTVPFLKTIYLMCKFEFKSVLFPLSSLTGRVYGIFKALLRSKKLIS